MPTTNPFAEARAFADELLAIAKATGDLTSVARLERMKHEFAAIERETAINNLPTGVTVGPDGLPRLAA